MIWTYIGGKWQTTTRAQRRLDVMDEWPTRYAERLRLLVHDSTTETAVWVQNSENSGKKRMHFVLYNCLSNDSQIGATVKIFPISADKTNMKAYFKGLVLGSLLMYWYLNFSAGLLAEFQHWFAAAR
jgi:hypothetical protein